MGRIQSILLYIILYTIGSPPNLSQICSGNKICEFMLHSISWKQFAEFIAWAAVVYYLWVVVRYYRHDIVGLLTGKRVKNVPETDDQGKGDSTNKTKNI